MNRSDVHHVYPKDHLKSQGLSRGRCNQIANFVLAQSEINIAIVKSAPMKYFAELADHVPAERRNTEGSRTPPTCVPTCERIAYRSRFSTAKSQNTTTSSKCAAS